MRSMPNGWVFLKELTQPTEQPAYSALSLPGSLASRHLPCLLNPHSKQLSPWKDPTFPPGKLPALREAVPTSTPPSLALPAYGDWVISPCRASDHVPLNVLSLKRPPFTSQALQRKEVRFLHLLEPFLLRCLLTSRKDSHPSTPLQAVLHTAA